MKTSPPSTRHGKNHSAAHCGAFEKLDQYVFQHPLRDVPGKLFLQEPLRLTGLEVSLNKFPPGAAMPFLHAHQSHEELYIFVKGRGQMLVDGELMDVSEGTTVRVAPKGERAWRNVGSEPLYFIVIQAPANGIRTGTTTDGVKVEQALVWPEN